MSVDGVNTVDIGPNTQVTRTVTDPISGESSSVVEITKDWKVCERYCDQFLDTQVTSQSWFIEHNSFLVAVGAPILYCTDIGGHLFKLVERSEVSNSKPSGIEDAITPTAHSNEKKHLQFAVKSTHSSNGILQSFIKKQNEVTTTERGKHKRKSPCEPEEAVKITKLESNPIDESSASASDSVPKLRITVSKSGRAGERYSISTVGQEASPILLTEADFFKSLSEEIMRIANLDYDGFKSYLDDLSIEPQFESNQEKVTLSALRSVIEQMEKEQCYSLNSIEFKEHWRGWVCSLYNRGIITQSDECKKISLDCCNLLVAKGTLGKRVKRLHESISKLGTLHCDKVNFLEELKKLGAIIMTKVELEMTKEYSKQNDEEIARLRD
ncbi:hypothetical protein SOPP22_00820 [Shewanella sp. OPT22]|nr:hypothetical protein SOPP22_00820 [Shewanella sp. OPT22]